MKKLIVALVVAGLAAAAQAELLIGFDVTGLPGNGPNATSVVQAANVQISYLTRGGGLTAASAANSFSASAWTVGLTADDALSNNDYFEFTVAADSGYFLSITNFEWRFSRSSTGPTNIALRSSLDSYASDLAVWSQPSAAAINFSNTLSIAGVQSVTFRLLGYRAGLTSGTARIVDGGGFGQAGIDLAVFGTVATIPEPATLGLLGLGIATLGLARKLRR